eukprot:TRINITY_DN12345_c0_g1_i7.p2 TRINITY_DN12345_c0_g1~~TRINITY_DN12345_c0_g1_i7.p2  ORF type:complete len:193 (+),score=46.01 TRINITY_DN12345_c0_g1_i7:120-698(+)
MQAFDGAYQDASRALQHGLDETVLNTRGVIALYMQQPAAAVTDFQQAIKAGSNTALPHYNLGLVYLAKQQLIQAKEAFEQAMTIDQAKTADRLEKAGQDADQLAAGFEATILVNLAIVKAKLGQRREALALLEQAESSSSLANEERCDYLWWNMAVLWSQLDNRDKARELWNKVVEAKPDSQEAQYMLALLS